MKIVYKCSNKDCKYPDVVIHDPVDDNLICSCGSTAWGHHTNVEDKEKKQVSE